MDVSILKINEVSYNIKDQTARTADSALTAANSAFKASYSEETITFTSVGG